MQNAGDLIATARQRLLTSSLSFIFRLSSPRPLDLQNPDKIFSTKKQKKMCERMVSRQLCTVQTADGT